MISASDVDRIIGAEVVDPNNDKVGKVSQVYLDSESDDPTWVSVKTGLFGLSETLVPIDDASFDDGGLHVGVEKARVKDAPRVEPDADITPDEQDRLYDYYERGAVDYGSTSADGTADMSGGASDTMAGTADRDRGAGGSRDEQRMDQRADRRDDEAPRRDEQGSRQDERAGLSADRGGVDDAGFGDRGGSGDGTHLVATDETTMIAPADDLDDRSSAESDRSGPRSASGHAGVGGADAGAGFEHGASARDGGLTGDSAPRAQGAADDGSQVAPTGRQRMRRYVVTEQQLATMAAERETAQGGPSLLDEQLVVIEVADQADADGSNDIETRLRADQRRDGGSDVMS